MTLFSIFAQKIIKNGAVIFWKVQKRLELSRKMWKENSWGEINSLKGWFFPSQTRFLECHQPNRTELKILWFESDQMTQVSNTFEASLYIQRGNYILSQSRKASCKEKNLTRLAIWTIPQNGKVIYLSVQSFSLPLSLFFFKSRKQRNLPTKVRTTQAQ